jgi:hypothetical protein
MLLVILLLSACTPRPLAGSYNFETLGDDGTCGDIPQPAYALGGGVSEFGVDNVEGEQFDLTLVPLSGDETRLTCSMTDGHFSCGASFERVGGWTNTIAAGGAWLSEREATLYWGMFQDCELGASCTDEQTCTMFAQFRITHDGG